MRVTLASASPRRRELIKKIDGLDVTVRVSGADENISERIPDKLAMMLATIKAEAVFNEVGGIVIGADTVVAVGDRILGKPKTKTEAEEFFKLLCSRTHEVITGLAVISEKRTVITAETTRVTFNEYDDALVEEYIKSGSPFDKAGGYGAQDEMLAPLIASIDGDEDNVIGLPVALLRKTLEENDW